MLPQKRNPKQKRITNRIKVAFAQLALLTLVFEPKAQIKSNTTLTMGIAISKIVMSQLPTDIGCSKESER